MLRPRRQSTLSCNGINVRYKQQYQYCNSHIAAVDAPTQRLLKRVIRRIVQRQNNRNNLAEPHCLKKVIASVHGCSKDHDTHDLISTDGGILHEIDYADILTRVIMCGIDPLLPATSTETNQESDSDGGCACDQT
jgi:hypothetical protein